MDVVLLALLIDALMGDPPGLYRRIPHPVVMFGHAISFFDRTLNRAGDPGWRRRLAGVGTLVLLAAGAGVLGWGIEAALAALPHGWVPAALVASTLIAQRSLYEHVAAVAAGLETRGLAGGRKAVALIVGRDPESLDQAGVARAAIESAAENFSDGVVAPVFWLALAGLPGLFIYKAVNTADSMIGHRTERYRDFGWASARIDDGLNLLPARLAGGLLALAAAPHTGRALMIMLRDARLHRSPNAGWPEAAMAGGLGVALAGPRRYGDLVVEDPWLNPGAGPAGPAEIRRALRLMVTACAALWVGVALLAALGC